MVRRPIDDVDRHVVRLVAWSNPPGTFVGSTGLYAPVVTYSVASCTDGTSNTIAYSETLVGDSKATAVYMDGRRDLTAEHLSRQYHLYAKHGGEGPRCLDQPGSHAGGIAGLRNGHANSGRPDSGHPRLSMVVRDHWIYHVQHDSDSQRFGVSVRRCRPFDSNPTNYPDDGFSYDANSDTPRRREHALWRRKLQVHQEFHRPKHLVVSGHQSQRRSCQLR